VGDERAAACLSDRSDEIPHEAVVRRRIDPESVLDSDGQGDRVADCADAFRDQIRLGHQARTERAALHALARAADVQVDLVVAVSFGDFRAMRQIVGLASTKLHAKRMLARMMREMAFDVAVDQAPVVIISV
jgi:hypothetical protein